MTSSELDTEAELRKARIAALMAIASSEEGLTTAKLLESRFAVLLSLAEGLPSGSQRASAVHKAFKAVVAEAWKVATTVEKGERHGEAAQISAAGELLGITDDDSLIARRDPKFYEYLTSRLKSSAVERRQLRAGAWLYYGSKDGAYRNAEIRWWPAFLTAVELHIASQGPRSCVSRDISLSGTVRQALDPARATCAAKGRAFYTPDLLYALFDVQGSRLPSLFDEAGEDLADRVRSWLVRRVNSLNVQRPAPFRFFEWAERDEVQRAEELAALDGTRFLTEIHLLIGVLEGSSTTREQLQTFPSLHFDRLLNAANRRRRESGSYQRTPKDGECDA